MYEWSSELLNEFGDVVTAVRGKQLKNITLFDNLFLIKDYGSFQETFAEVKSGKLPKLFKNGKKIPNKFEKELNKLPVAEQKV
jgi:hypothetical protein